TPRTRTAEFRRRRGCRPRSRLAPVRGEIDRRVEYLRDVLHAVDRHRAVHPLDRVLVSLVARRLIARIDGDDLLDNETQTKSLVADVHGATSCIISAAARSDTEASSMLCKSSAS